MLLIPVNAISGVVERPSRNYEDYAIYCYGWMASIKGYQFDVELNQLASKIISAKQIGQYVKDKTKENIPDIKIDENNRSSKSNLFGIKVELFEYSKSSKYIFGLVSLKLYGSVDYEGNSEKIYELTNPIAGSEDQIKEFVTLLIGKTIEVLAEDYYYMRKINR